MMPPKRGEAPDINPRRGEVWRVALEPVVGAELEKTRPVVIMNRPGVGRPTVRLCVPVTEWKREAALLYWRVSLATSNAIHKPSSADVSQTRALDTRRFGEKLGKVDAAELEAIAGALARFVGYAPDSPSPQNSTTE